MHQVAETKTCKVFILIFVSQEEFLGKDDIIVCVYLHNSIIRLAVTNSEIFNKHYQQKSNQLKIAVLTYLVT